MVTEDSKSEIFEAIKNDTIKLKDAVYLYEVGIKDDKLLKEFKNKLKKLGADFTLRSKPTTQDESIQFQKRQFDLLFEKDKFRDNILVFFKNGDEIESSILDIPKWYTDKFYYSDIRLEFIRKQFNFSKPLGLSKEKVLAFFAGTETQNILNKLIFEKIKHHNYLLTTEQHEQLRKWVLELSKNADFRNAINNVSNNSMSVDRLCLKLFEYKKVLDLSFDKETSLDLLSFDDIHNVSANMLDRYEIYFDKIINEIEDLPLVTARIRENLEQNVKYAPVLGYHIIFSVDHNLTDNYKLIEGIITNLLPEIQTGHFHDNPLLLYYKQTKNFAFLAEHFPIETNDLYWSIIEMLITDGGQANFVENKLNEFFDSTDDYNLKLKLAAKLLRNNSTGSLSKFVSVIKKIKEENISTDFHWHEFTSSVNEYEHEEIKAGIEMIKLTYIHEFDDFNNPQSAIIGYYNNLIKSNKELYSFITSAILDLINDNKGKLTNIQFLEMQLPMLRNIYFSAHKSNYTFKLAMKILEDSEI